MTQDEKPKHTKITTYETQADGSIKGETLSYFEELSSRKEFVVQSIRTSVATILADTVGCLDVIQKQQTKKLVITVTVDEFNKPNLIVKEYIVKNENFKKR